MHLIYTCPFCKASINAKKHIILAVRAENDADNKGLALLHEEIGNYTVAMSSSLKIKSGELVDFFCPVCNESLNSNKEDNLASFSREDETGAETTIYISRVYGERCTFQVDDKKRIKTYGDSVRQFMNPEWFI